MWILLSPIMLGGLLYVLTVWTADCFTVGADAYKKIKKSAKGDKKDDSHGI